MSRLSSLPRRDIPINAINSGTAFWKNKMHDTPIRDGRRTIPGATDELCQPVVNGTGLPLILKYIAAFRRS